MRTAGVDLASQDRHTALCRIDWSPSGARVRELALGVTDARITELVASVDKLGIDVPLGWPVAFAEAVAGHSRGGDWPASYRHDDAVAYRLRRTDRWVWEALGTSPPLSVSTDRIALPAMRAAALVSRLSPPTALDGSDVVVEAYPAAALRRWDLPWRGYKRKENAAARRQLVTSLRERTVEWLALDETQVELCLDSDDALDALVASLVARAAALDLVEPVPPDARAQARREGWIAVPVPGSLSRLAESGR